MRMRLMRLAVLVLAPVACAVEKAPPRPIDSPTLPSAYVEAPGPSPDEVRPVPTDCEIQRADHCRGLAVRAEVFRAQGAAFMIAGEEVEVATLHPWIAGYCDQSVDSCLLVEDVLDGGSKDPRVLDMLQANEFSAEIVADPRSAASLESDCKGGDARACYLRVDLELVLFGCAPEEQAAREVAVQHWQRACDLEPIVYCAGLEDANWEWVNISCG